ncbi:MAG: hypothetical protein QM702_20705 [Rubrivivax sp.]
MTARQRAPSEAEMARANLDKLVAEALKLSAESLKLAAEQAKLQRERMWYPMLISTGLIAAGAGLATAILRI